MCSEESTQNIFHKIGGEVRRWEVMEEGRVEGLIGVWMVVDDSGDFVDSSSGFRGERRWGR